MTNLATPLRSPKEAPAALEPLKQWMLAHTPSEGHTQIAFPDMCLYRFSRPSTFRKAATFGVTLGVVLQGQKKLRVEGHELTISPENFLVITRETEHESAALQATPERPYLGMSLCFDPEHVARAMLSLTEAGETNTHETMPAFVLPFDSRLADALRRLFVSLDDPIERKLLAPLAAQEILLRLLRSDAAAAVRGGVGLAADAGRILDAMQFMRAHAAEGLSVQQIARRVAMSPSHFAHRFRAVARTSPMRYLRNVRLDQARSLLLGGQSRIGEVASQLGYESPAHFTREFKRRFGSPPTHYLKRLSEN
jgi:AraC-like DNA-binding protein